MRTLAYLPAILLVAPICTATAQDRTSPLEHGQRVRVTAPELGITRQAATFNALDGGVLTVTADSTMQCPLADVTRLEVHAGRRSFTTHGALIGAGAGLLSGVIVGAIEQSRYECDPDNAWGPCIPPLPTIPIMFGVLGAGLGYLAGSLIKGDRWEDVPLDRLRVSVGPQREGFGIGASIAF